MKRIVFIIISCCLVFATVQAQRITLEYKNVSLSEALRQLNEQTEDYTISFLYNELEDFRITTSIHRKSIPDAIRQMIGFYPIRMTVENREIIVECPQKTDLRYKGNIIDEQGKPIAFANIALLSPQDSTLIAGGVSNESGIFVIPCEQKPVIVRISFVGYKTICKQCNGTDLGTIRMQLDNISIEAVKVIGNAIQNSVSGYKVNVKALQYAKDKLLTELLPYLPGINIDHDKINILGNVVTAYYIDGIRNTDPAILKSLSTDKIESIEVDYISGVDEDKSAVGGIIRITTRREVNGGFSGNIGAAMTLQPSNGIYNEVVSNTFSASIDKLYMFNKISFSNNTPKIHEEETYTPKSDDNNSNSTDRRGKYKRKYLNEYLGLSYEINQSQQLKSSVWYSYANSDINEIGQTTKADGIHTSTRHNPNLSHVIQGVTDYVWKPKTGHQFNFMLDYLYKHQRDRQYSILDNIPTAELSQVQNTHMLRIQPKWQLPLGKSLIMTTGLDYQQTHYSNDLLHKTTMNSYAPAAFAKIQGGTQAIKYEFGLRTQQTSMKVKVDDIKNEHNDFGIFPTVNLMWMMNPKRQHILNFMYKYSMDDLPYSVVSSYRNYSSPYNYEIGNPELKAPTGHTLILMAKLWGNWTLASTYLRAIDEIHFVREQSPESPSIAQIKPYNCAYIDGLIFVTEYLLKVENVWTSKPQVIFRRWSGEVQGEHFSNPFCFLFNWNNDFHFSPTFSGELSFHYEPTESFLDMTYKPVYSMRLALRKSFCKERLLLKLETMPFVKNRKVISDNQRVRTTYYNLTKEQYLKFSVTWRFKGGKNLKEQSTANSIQNYKQFEKDK